MRSSTPLIAILALLVTPSCSFLKVKGNERKWEPRILEITKGIDYSPYANGRGAVDRGGFVRKSNKDYHKHIIDCKPGVWGDAKHYRGGRKDAIYRFCIRLHEKHQRKREFSGSPRKYDCMMDPGDDGNNHGHKDRDWLCFERRPRFVALPPHGPPLDPTCTENLTTWRALSWYTDKAPPEWCPYNWYHKRQVCWCIPGYVRESLYDGSINKRGCPNTRSIFIVPRFVTYEEWEKLRNPTTTPPPLPENQTTTAEPGNAPSVRLLDDDDF